MARLTIFMEGNSGPPIDLSHYMRIDAQENVEPEDIQIISPETGPSLVIVSERCTSEDIEAAILRNRERVRREAF